jgi:protein farnesyltransferase subunit beta
VLSLVTHATPVGASLSAAAAANDLYPNGLLGRLCSPHAHEPADGTIGTFSEKEAGVDGSQPEMLFDARALQAWILVACQDKKGLRDKPSRPADFYHTCYCLSGLATCQAYCGQVFGDVNRNRLSPTDACLNVGPAELERARAFYSSRPVT